MFRMLDRVKTAARLTSSGASRDLGIEIARQNELIIYADEVYDKVLYDGVEHTAMGSLS